MAANLDTAVLAVGGLVGVDDEVGRRRGEECLDVLEDERMVGLEREQIVAAASRMVWQC